ncbi:hypothetical protein [Sulfitobacter profundi]|uniref:Uncharacterized protein n=1 Tax=Sulfitobacter profundi TaxID=2679961 RepID=A0ABW1Z0Q4_9RHOB
MRVIIAHQVGEKLLDLGHANVLPPPHPHQRRKAFDHGPSIGGRHRDAFLGAEIQPRESVVRDDVRPIPPTRPPGAVHGKDTKPRHAMGHEAGGLPKPRVMARHPIA